MGSSTCSHQTRFLLAIYQNKYFIKFEDFITSEKMKNLIIFVTIGCLLLASVQAAPLEKQLLDKCSRGFDTVADKCESKRTAYSRGKAKAQKFWSECDCENQLRMSTSNRGK